MSIIESVLGMVDITLSMEPRSGRGGIGVGSAPELQSSGRAMLTIEV